MTLYLGTNNVCVYRVARANQVPLTNKHLERYWKISHLNDGQADMMPVVEGAHGQE